MIALWIALCASTVEAKDRPAPLPEPLKPRPMQIADPEIGKLSNGIEVRVASNHEVPLFEVRLVVGVGSYADPVGKEGTTLLAFDMLDEGAGNRDAAAIATELKRLAGDVGSSAGPDSGTVAAAGLKRNLEPILDVWTDVIRRPTFPEKEWSIVQNRVVSGLELASEDANEIARRAYRRLVWGDGYIGRSATKETVGGLQRTDVQAFYGKHVGPDNAIILVGGDVTLAEILPILEKRLGDWKVDGFQEVPVVAETARADGEVIYLIDKPGAAQSVVRGVTTIGTLEDADVFDLMVGNYMFAQDFTGRVNLNLREDKGYTYGASCMPIYIHGPGVFMCNTSVRTDATAKSLIELRKEVADVLGSRPMTDQEIATAKDSMAFGWPTGFETTGRLLDLEFEIWRYGKPEDWAAEYIPNVRKVTPASANAALKKALVPAQMFWLVVGDKAVIREELRALGLPVLELDRTGRPLE